MPGAYSLKPMLSFGVVIVLIFFRGFHPVYKQFRSSSGAKRSWRCTGSLAWKEACRQNPFLRVALCLHDQRRPRPYRHIARERMFPAAASDRKNPDDTRVFTGTRDRMVYSRFVMIFIMILLTNLLCRQTASPIKLLQEKKTGRAGTPILLDSDPCWPGYAGRSLCLCATVKSPLAALGLFFLAALMVIIGTLPCSPRQHRCAETLKRNRRFYYRPENPSPYPVHDVPDEAECRRPREHMHPEHHGADHAVHSHCQNCMLARTISCGSVSAGYNHHLGCRFDVTGGHGETRGCNRSAICGHADGQGYFPAAGGACAKIRIPSSMRIIQA